MRGGRQQHDASSQRWLFSGGAEAAGHQDVAGPFCGLPGAAHLAADGKAAMAKLSMHVVSEACVAGGTRFMCSCSVPCASRVPTNRRPPSALIEAGQANRLEGSLTCVFLA